MFDDDYDDDDDGKVYAQANHPHESQDLVNDVGVKRQAASDEYLCLKLLRSAGEHGCTNDEIAAWFHENQKGRIIPVNQIASRVGTLRDTKRLVVAGAETDTRTTRRKREARVNYAIESAPADALFPPEGTDPLLRSDAMTCPTCDGAGVIDA